MKTKKRGNAKKGISPLIATVLIIGFTIVLAAVVITWGSDFILKLIQKGGCSNEVTIECTGKAVDVDIVGVNLNVQGDQDTLFLSLISDGDKDISNFVVRIHKDDGSVDTLDLSGDDGDAGTFGDNDPFILQSLQSDSVTLDIESNYANDGSDFDDCDNMFCGVSIMPQIEHTTDEGDTCEETCKQKKKKHDFLSGEITTT